MHWVVFYPHAVRVSHVLKRKVIFPCLFGISNKRCAYMNTCTHAHTHVREPIVTGFCVYFLSSGDVVLLLLFRNKSRVRGNHSTWS